MRSISYTKFLKKVVPGLPVRVLGALGVFVLGFIGAGTAQTTNPAPYCNVNDINCDFGSEPAITDVSIGSFSNSSGCNNENTVTYFNNLTPINAPRGQTLSGTITAESDPFFGSNDHGVAIWVDFNANGQFEASEQVYTDNKSGDVSTHNFSFQIPQNAQANCLTRMRIEVSEDETPNAGEACESSSTFEDGEMEDYQLNIGPALQQENIGVVGITNPDPEKQDLGLEEVKVQVRNLGGVKIKSGQTIPFSVNTSNLNNPRTFKYTFQQDLESCEGRELNLGVVSLACAGLNRLEVTADWGPDVLAADDTARVLYKSNPKVIFEDGFERSALGSDWTTSSQGRVEIFSGCGGPYKGQNFLSLDEGSGNSPNAWAQTEVDLSNTTNPELSFWFYNYDEITNGFDCNNNQGVFVSVDGGSTFVEILSLCQIQAGSWTQLTVDIKQALKDKGLSIPANGKIIIRFSQEDSLDRCGEGFGFDNVRIIDFDRAQPAPKPSNVLVAPDTVYVNSPTEFNSLSESDANVWSIDGQIVDSASFKYTATYPNTGRDSISLLSGGCFGIDTGKAFFPVVVPSTTPETDFIADRNVVDTNSVVSFTDESNIGPTKWRWFVNPRRVNGDTSFKFVESDYTSRNPQIRFRKSGQYDITLVAGNSQGFDTLTRTKYITVNEGYKICEDTRSDEASGILYDSAGAAEFDDDDAKQCQFTINPNCADSVVARFLSFNIAGEPVTQGGPRDNLKIYDGTSANAPAIHDQLGYPNGFYEGNRPSSSVDIVARSGAMTVIFNTNGDNSSEDFAMEWDAGQSLDPATRTQVMNAGLTGPDTAFTTGFTRYSVNNPVANATYKYIFPGLNTKVTSDTSAALRSQDVDEGTYPVSVVTRVCGYADTATKQVYFKDPVRKPVADFSASATELKPGDTVALIDQSRLGVNNWTWSIVPSGSVTFVNGTDENSRNPEITIRSAGQYRVELVVRSNVGGNVEDRLNYLDVTESCNPSVATTNDDYAINGFAIYEVGQGQLYSNTTGLSDNGYGEFNQQSAATLEAGKQYVFEITRNTAFNNFAYGGWLDSDNDGVFTKQERLFSGQNASGLVVRDTVTIPANAAEIGVADLRVATNLANAGLDGCGPHATGEFEDYSVTFVGDQTAPMITLKGGDSVTVDICNVAAADTGATAMDAVDGNLTNRIRVRNSELLQTPGVHNLQYTVRDDAGNRASKTQVITVTPDTVDPQITLNGPAQFDVPFEEDYEEQGFTTSDACGKVDTVTINGMVNNGVIGDYTLDYIVTDLAGNQDTATRTVNVFDAIPPRAQLVGPDTVRVPVFGEYDELGVEAIDNYRDSTLTRISGSVNTSEVGVYNLTYNVRDLDSNVVTLKRVVIVEDRQAPTYSGVPEDAVVLNVNSELDTDFVPEDNYYEASVLSLNRNGDFFRFFPDGVADSIGTFNARFTYTDGSGNTSTAAFGVKVVDREAPEIVLNRKTVNIDQYERFSDSLGVTYELEDNYYDAEAITLERSGNYFTSYVDSGFPNGLYNIRYEAVDPSGNRADAVVRGVNVQVTGLTDQEIEGSVKVYPNPTDGPVRIEVADVQQGPVTVQVINAKGQTVREISRQVTGNTGDYNVDLGDEAKGLYKVKVQTSENVVTESVIVQ